VTHSPSHSALSDKVKLAVGVWLNAIPVTKNKIIEVNNLPILTVFSKQFYESNEKSCNPVKNNQIDCNNI
jgi:hypothetical protein